MLDTYIHTHIRTYARHAKTSRNLFKNGQNGTKTHTYVHIYIRASIYHVETIRNGFRASQSGFLR